MNRKYHLDGSKPSENQIFVFGSNLSGIHGAGAARAAQLYYGAVYGVAEGITGRSYALPTVKKHIKGPLSLELINKAVKRFIEYAKKHPENEFLVTRVACVLAGYSDNQIAPMFKNAPENCSFAKDWQPFLDP